MFDRVFLDDAGSIFSLKRRGKKNLFPWKKGCQPSLVRFVVQMQPQLVLPLRLCGREALVTQERLKEPQDCDTGVGLMGSVALLSISTGCWLEMASPRDPGRGHDGTTQKGSHSEKTGQKSTAGAESRGG